MVTILVISVVNQKWRCKVFVVKCRVQCERQPLMPTQTVVCIRVAVPMAGAARWCLTIEIDRQRINRIEEILKGCQLLSD